MSTQPLDSKTAGEDLSRTAAATAVTRPDAGEEYLTVPLTAVVPSPSNPRKRFDDVELMELASSIKAQGILEPIIVRPNRNTTKGKIEPRFEIVAGERRFRAAKLAGLADVPIRIKHLSDKETLEIQVVENLQRKGLNALEESAGYRQLHEEHGHTVEEIAAKIGMSRAHVYARMKLNALTKEVAQLVVDGTLSPGHAIRLARLKPADQKRALDKNYGGVFTDDYYDGRDGSAQRDVASVRSLEQWIEDNVVADPGAVDTLTPEAASTLGTAIVEAQPVVLITRLEWSKGAWGQHHIVQAHDWKRADGQENSKACDQAVMGFVAVGPGQGEAFAVCVDTKKCRAHWPQKAKPAAGRSAAAQGPRRSKAVIEREKREIEKRRQERERQEEERRRWKRAAPAIAAAAAAGVKKAPAATDGPLGTFLLGAIGSGTFYVDASKRSKAAELVPRGKSAEDFVRHLAFALMYALVTDEWRGPRDLQKALRGLDVELKPLLAAATAEEEAAPKKAKRG